jgi:N-acyl-D-amino-acid deacylase
MRRFSFRRQFFHRNAAFLGALTLAVISSPAAQFDVLIRNGTIYDGSGGPPFAGDVAINGDRIADSGWPLAE